METVPHCKVGSQKIWRRYPTTLQRKQEHDLSDLTAVVDGVCAGIGKGERREQVLLVGTSARRGRCGRKEEGGEETN